MYTISWPSEQYEQRLTIYSESEIDALRSALNRLEERLRHERMTKSNSLDRFYMSEFRTKGLISAVKAHRTATGAGLRESKEYIENLIAECKATANIASKYE